MQNQSPDATPMERFAEENRQAEVFIEKEDLRNAAGVLVKIVEQDPQNWRAYNNMGILSWMREAWEDGYTMFKKSMELKVDYTDAMMNLFDACLKLRRIEQCRPLFRKALETAPDNDEIRILVESIESQGDDIYACERALMIGTYNPRIDEATRLLNDGKVNEALKILIDLNDTEGPSAEVFSGLGVVSYYQKQYQDAFTLFLESIKLNPVNPDTYLNLLDAGAMIGRSGEARQIWEVYRKEFPTTLDTLEAEFNQHAPV